jgi:hypothetical protein
MFNLKKASQCMKACGVHQWNAERRAIGCGGITTWRRLANLYSTGQAANFVHAMAKIEQSVARLQLERLQMEKHNARAW